MKLKKFSSSTPESEFDSWFSETHNGTGPVWEMEEDVDETLEDDYSEGDNE